ncbi:hypothetical protein BD410DRAFT_777737 [Rickenella mellea]|uniref:BUB1 N-terminal domain-containing protein n=1 Tax=Rickenella mellea TaxID=50990 RepID=A0A4Y7PL84_9AGAM|nr:hypothetical protein BD410DRAFT_777737 [Rickenella mellea]
MNNDDDTLIVADDDVKDANGNAEAPIVDIAILEASKENIQPLAKGRCVTTLSALFSTPHAQRDARLSASRARLRAAVDASLLPSPSSSSSSSTPTISPLEAYCDFVYWTIEHYPQGHSAESGILELLEEATRMLKDDTACKSDLRYLKLWVLYASYVEKPAVIYAYLLANEIGSMHAVLYEEYALVLERDGRRTKADEIYLLGIARHAEPLEHLQKRHRDFQKRMMTAAPAPNAPPTPPPPSTTPGTRRTVLGTTSTAPASLQREASAPSGSSSRRMAVFTDSATKSNARIPVFIDPSGDQDTDPTAGNTNAWPDVGTRKSRIKENVPETRQMGGTKLHQSSTGLRNAASRGGGGVARIVPFRDPVPDEDADADMPPPAVPSAAVPPKTPAKASFVPFCDAAESTMSMGPPATPGFAPLRDEVTSTSITSPAIPQSGSGSDGVMKLRAHGSLRSEAEALRRDPFKNYNDRDTD